MQRTVEPELMDDETQAKAYANADFEDAHNQIIEAFDLNFPNEDMEGQILDLGCGPGDITFRFAARFPETSVIGIDGSNEMIKLANERKTGEIQLRDRVAFVEGFIPGAPIPSGPYTAVVSNSLLHHLHHPEVLWETVSQYTSPGSKIFIMDLFRPTCEEDAQQVVNECAANEPKILQRDFYNSLLAAFEPQEIRQQLVDANLSELVVKVISDRHVLVFGEKH
ncbi:MAG: class I SAM-dependent methyltransferase [Candidatus Latescibacteria bacterium]|nr:class I SAM-dependent methyltransferase [Candidatus Latescibacterota bacterium]MBT5832020.1 class I SAM-dependent methyltransferase [Candidatus Latescibacterota bacterium]